MLSILKKQITQTFVTGLLVTLPLAFTFFILNFLLAGIDNTFSPVFARILILLGAPVAVDFRVPGVGVILTVAVIFLAGLLTRNILGEKVVRLGESILNRIPVVRGIYAGSKQMITTVIQTDSKAFSMCGLVEFPRKGLYTLGFVTSATKGEIREKAGEGTVSFFIPTTPNPTSGFLLFVPKTDIIELQMSIDDGLKLVISGGILTPPYDPAQFPAGARAAEIKDLKS